MLASMADEGVVTSLSGRPHLIGKPARESRLMAAAQDAFKCLAPAMTTIWFDASGVANKALKVVYETEAIAKSGVLSVDMNTKLTHASQMKFYFRLDSWRKLKKIAVHSYSEKLHGSTWCQYSSFCLVWLQIVPPHDSGSLMEKPFRRSTVELAR